jgi:hypothetical protein
MRCARCACPSSAKTAQGCSINRQVQRMASRANRLILLRKDPRGTGLPPELRRSVYFSPPQFLSRRVLKSRVCLCCGGGSGCGMPGGDRRGRCFNFLRRGCEWAPPADFDSRAGLCGRHDGSFAGGGRARPAGAVARRCWTICPKRFARPGCRSVHGKPGAKQ